jgi:hypothetical protein
MSAFRRTVAAIAAASVLGTTFPALAQPAAVEAPALVTTTEALAGNSVQQRLGALLERAEVREALAARGVDPAQVEARVAALSDQEARLLAEQLDRLPAGASDVLGVLFAVFLILLITDILGLTKVFPFTKAIR